MSKVKTNQWIAVLTGSLVFLVAVGSFVLSYNNLRLLAVESGINETLSYIWPLLIDASLIVFSLATVNAYLHSESAWKQWALVGLYTAATIGFNVLHAPDGWQARITAAIAPVSLFFSFEILMSQLKNSVERSSLVQSIERLERELERRRLEFDARLERMRLTLRRKFDQERSALNAELNELTQEVDERRLTAQALDGRIEQLQSQLNSLERQQETPSAVQNSALNEVNVQRLDSKQEAMSALLDFYRSNPLASLAEAGEAIERSKGTVSNYLGELEQDGLVHRNGNGVEVLV